MGEFESHAAARIAPLVEPAPSLSDDARERAARQMLLPGFGESAQRRLRAARVLVIGAGGLGSASVPYLTGSGVGTIGIVDDDAVELSNLHRQIAHGTKDLGRPKVTSLAETARAIDPNVTIVEHGLRLTATNALEIFAGYDLVIDGSDNYQTRYLANDAAQLAGIPLVWGAILAHHGQVSVAWHEHGPGYRDLFPTPPDPSEVVTCSSGGVLSGLCGTIGSLLATETLKLITGIGEPLIGRVLVYDALRASTRELSYERDPQAQAVTELVDYEALCAGPGAPPELDPRELIQMFERGTVIRLIDTRGQNERAASRVEPSVALPLPELERCGPTALKLAGAGGEAVAVYCATGPRSIRAAKLLRDQGIDARYVPGGIEAIARLAPHLVSSGVEVGVEDQPSPPLTTLISHTAQQGAQ